MLLSEPSGLMLASSGTSTSQRAQPAIPEAGASSATHAPAAPVGPPGSQTLQPTKALSWKGIRNLRLQLLGSRHHSLEKDQRHGFCIQLQAPPEHAV